MVNALINDGSLIGFWTLHGQSGVAAFHNYSPRSANKPSGLSLDFMVHACQSNVGNNDEARTPWPGTSSRVLLGTSGVPHTATYVAASQYGPLGDSSQNGHVLIMGEGGQISRQMIMPPRIAQSGITLGFWVNPQSNGHADFLLPGSGAARTFGKLHSLLQLADRSHGFIIGVSGLLANAAQEGLGTDPKGLAAYVLNLGGSTTAGNANEVHINTPIESGTFTHLTFVYRILVDTSNNNTHTFALFKNGKVAASGQRTGVSNATMPVLNNANFNIRSLCVGGTILEVDKTDRYAFATGHEHLISGVYAFNRPLNEAEVEILHGAGGFQINEGVDKRDANEVLLSDSKLLGYYPFYGPGYADIKPSHNALISRSDEGDETHWVTTTGPFGRGGVFNYGTLGIGLAANSGLTTSLISNRSFSVAGWFAPDNATAATTNFDECLLFSMGEVNTSITGSLTGACFYVSSDSANVRYLARFFPLGLSTTAVVELRGFEINQFEKVVTHVGIAYDDQTLGVALYVNGFLQQSGTLVHSLASQVSRVANSGFPLVFLNGVQTSILSDTTPYLATGGGQYGADLCVFGRPLLQQEFLFLAQSGIKSTDLLRTRNDPRIMGYWKSNTSDPQAMIIEDLARVWERQPANLVRSSNDAVLDQIELTDNQGPWYRRDEFSRLYSTPPELASYLPLGITSGIWVINGGGLGTNRNTTGNRNSSISSFLSRFKPFIEQRSLQPTTPYNYLLSYEVIPSGNIRSLGIGSVMTINGNRFNSLLHFDGQEGGQESSYSYLTRNAHTVGQAAGSSGVTIVFEGRDGATSFTPIASGNISFGVPSRILLNLGFSSPYFFGDANGVPVVNIELYINGIKSYSRIVSSTNSRFWSAGIPLSADDHIIQFGGVAADITTALKISSALGESGLGEIYLRNIFIMKGNLSADDITYFATSGILDTTSIAGYTDEQNTTQVTVSHPNLRGYYRFAGGASGELDLSLKHNNLFPFASFLAPNGFSSIGDNPAQNLRFVPGPLKLSDLGVQSSGITYEGNAFAAGNVVPPFVASGSIFTRPDFGFAVGFWYTKRETIAGNTSYQPLVSFGVLPATSAPALTDIDKNRSWAVIWDSDENLQMVVSQSGTGSMYFRTNTVNAAQSGTKLCGMFQSATTPVSKPVLSDNNDSDMFPGYIDSWNHVLWSYDATDRLLTCYSNGNRVDQMHISSGVNLPLDASARFISIFIPQTGVWSWSNSANTDDVDSYITDLCYFSAPITAAEARYIAYNGIDTAIGVPASGLVGGYLQGQDTGSGLIGGYFQGQDTGSGLIGGYMPGGILCSGLTGGYVSGLIFAEGTIGGFVRGSDTGSGIIAGYILGADLGSGLIGGYIRGLNTASGLIGGLITGATLSSGIIGGYMLSSAQCSGLIGGFITGGLRGFFSFDAGYTVSMLAAKDFDAQLEIAKTDSADFDAKLVIFQNESGPLVEIQIPGSTVTGQTPPFNQYFIGRASGVQGKTITQTRWNFGDFTPQVTSSLSGADFYPVLHRFASSGFYIVKFEAIDSNGIHGSDTRIINAASGIDPVIITLSGVPRSGNAALLVDFSTTVDILPPGVSISAQLLNYDDGQSTIATNPSHSYSEPGNYKPIWYVRDSRGIVWCDGLKIGSDLLSGSED